MTPTIQDLIDRPTLATDPSRGDLKLDDGRFRVWCEWGGWIAVERLTAGAWIEVQRYREGRLGRCPRICPTGPCGPNCSTCRFDEQKGDHR